MVKTADTYDQYNFHMIKSHLMFDLLKEVAIDRKYDGLLYMVTVNDRDPTYVMCDGKEGVDEIVKSIQKGRTKARNKVYTFSLSGKPQMILVDLNPLYPCSETYSPSLASKNHYFL